MTLSWTPVIAVDVVGSLLTLMIALVCASLAWEWNRKKREDIFRDYIFLLTCAFVFFAISRSFGHLIKQYLLAMDMKEAWQTISPYSGAVNTASFIVVFSFGIYFQRFRTIHGELQEYKDNLEELVDERTRELEKVNVSLKEENRHRRKAEENVRRVMTTLENIFNSTSPTCITDINHVLLEANEAYLALWPGPGTDDQKMMCYESRPSSICRTPDCPLEKIIRGDEQTTCETTRRAAGGSEQVFLQTTKPFRDMNGKLVGTVTSFQEITARKKALDALAAERERLAVTLRSIGDGVITTDRNGQVVLINRVAEQLCGWTQKEAKGKNLSEVFNIIDETTGVTVRNPVEHVMTTGEIVNLEANTVLVAKDGSRINIADSGAPIRDAQSRTVGVVLVFRDVTNQLFLERELQKSQKLESIGILAGGIAHDFNNILAAILGNIDLAIHRLDEDNPAVPLLHEAEKASLRAKGLTYQLLTFAKGGSPVRKAVSIGGIISESADFVLHGSNVKCEMDIPDDLQLVDIDPDQMSQVIQNIILNARESMEGGGRVKISARNREGEIAGLETAQRDWVEITISDTGQGMTRETTDKIFDPFFSTKEHGKGLGLSICYSIISKHKGSIQVDSHPGEGTTVTLLLPALSDYQNDRPAKPVEISPDKNIRVLVMDDEEIVRDIVEEMLTYMGFEAVVVNDGEQAVEKYEQAMQEGKSFDLVITDLTIPGGMGGRDTVRQILKIDPTARVVVASGYSNDPIMAAYEDYGFCAAVVKPFDLQELTDIIQGILQRP